MKKEELDKLKENYWSGNSSLEEEKLLKDQVNEPFFNQLKIDDTKMDWEFEDFMAQVNDSSETNTNRPVLKFNKMIIAFSAIAASLILGFYFIKPADDHEIMKETRIANQEDSTIEQTKPITHVVKPQQQIIAYTEVKEAKSSLQKRNTAKVNPTAEIHSEEQFYVEVNGVRIYDEEEALEITETALQLASTNLKAGMKGVEKIKYLNIQL